MIGGRLDHIAIHVADRNVAKVVVRELLGHEHLQDLEVPGEGGIARLTVMTQRRDRFRLVLCDAEGATHPINEWVDARGPGVHHVAHRVSEIAGALAGVEAAGGQRVGVVVDGPGLRQVFTEVTHDGLLHELTERLPSTEGFVARNTAALIEAGADKNAVRPPPAPWNDDRR